MSSVKAVAGNFEKFVALARFAAENSNFYAKILREFVRRPDLDAMGRIEVIGPDEMYRYGPPESTEMLTGPMTGGYITRSGGSSGREKYAFTSYEEAAYGAGLLGTMFRNLGIDGNDRVANLFMPGHMYSAFASVCLALEHTGCLQLPIGANTEPEQIFAYLETFAPNVLLAVPSLIMGVAEQVEKGGRRIGFRKIGYAGEHLSGSSRQYLKSVFGQDLEIFSLGYAAVDTGIIAYQDASCSGIRHRVPVDYVLVEILDPVSGRPLDFGEEGDIVVSNLYRRSMPVIRYHVGDRGILYPAADGGDPLLDLLGRSGGDIMLCGYRVPLSVFRRAFGKVAPDAALQLHIRAEGPKIKLDFRYENTETDSFEERDLEGELRRESELVAGMFDGGILLPPTLARFAPGVLPRNEVTGKLIQVIDERSSA